MLILLTKGMYYYGAHGKAKNDNRLSGLLEASERYYRDIDYAEYYDLKRENKHLERHNIDIKHYFMYNQLG